MRRRPPHPNDTRVPHPRREACEELARHLAEDEGLRTARLLELVGGRPPVPPLALAGVENGHEPHPISIWQPLEDDGELIFERPPTHPLGDHYAARLRFRARKEGGRRRLVFLGESVAAGYLYAPHLTPAEVLEAQLCHVEPWEVIDLARTNETLAGLAKTAVAARQLEPDALVVFAGNNWDLLETPEISPYVSQPAARQAWATALDGGWDGPVKLAEQRLQQRANAAFTHLAATPCPVVLVAPEVNLADWESRQPVPWLPGDATPRWWSLHDSALAHLAARRFEEALAAARAMRALDDGVVGTADRLAARAEVGRGGLDAALAAARAEVDHTTYPTLAFLDAPRAGTVTHRVLKRAATRHDFALVDLRSHFATATDEVLPGRRLFLDYCHLSFEGIRLAMAATAAKVLEQTAEREVPWRDLTGIPAAVDPDVEALARFGAAIHGAHRLLAGDAKETFLEPWCRAALEASATIAGAFRDLAEARAAPLPTVLSSAQERNFRSPHRLLLQHGWRWDFLDADLLAACDRALEAAGRDPTAGSSTGLIESVVVQRAIGDRDVELAAPPYLWEPLERLYSEVMDFADLDRRATLRSLLPRTHFILVHGGQGSIELDLTARLPAIEGWDGRREGEARILVDGAEVARWALGERFTRRRLLLPRQDLERGVRKLTLMWPPLPPAGGEALAAARRQLQMGLEATVHPVFGEVHSLRAKRVR